MKTISTCPDCKRPIGHLETWVIPGENWCYASTGIARFIADCLRSQVAALRASDLASNDALLKCRAEMHAACDKLNLAIAKRDVEIASIRDMHAAEIERLRIDHADALVFLNARRNEVQAELDAIKGPIDMKKEMVCVQCLARITATITQAKQHGWAVWVGGARCKACCEQTAQEPANG